MICKSFPKFCKVHLCGSQKVTRCHSCTSMPASTKVLPNLPSFTSSHSFSSQTKMKTWTFWSAISENRSDRKSHQSSSSMSLKINKKSWASEATCSMSPSRFRWLRAFTMATGALCFPSSEPVSAWGSHRALRQSPRIPGHSCPKLETERDGVHLQPKPGNHVFFFNMEIILLYGLTMPYL